MKYYHIKQQYHKLMCQQGRFGRFLAILALFTLLFSCAGGAKFASIGLGKASDPVPFMENARTGVLPSGMRYYLLENSRPEGRAYLTLAVDAGSVLETEEERGLAHFVEHMAFNGTARFQKSELVNYLRSLGMRFGPEVNAYTTFDSTVYGIEVPVETGPDGRKTIPDRALAVIDDWTWSVAFAPEDVDAERLVIMEEYRTRLGARERINQEIYPVLFRGSPYAERLPIGLPEVIENAPVERLEEFYKKWYRPENMAVIIVGDFDAAFLEAQLAEHFPVHHAASGETFRRPRYNLSEPEKGSIVTLVVTDSELSQSRVDLNWIRKAEPLRGDLANYRDELIDNLVDIMSYLRFQEAAAKSDAPFGWASAAAYIFAHSSRLYSIVAQPKTGLVNETMEELLLVKESLSRYGFSQYEIDDAKAALISDREQAVSEKDRQSSNSYVRAFTWHFLDGEPVPDATWELEAAEKLLPGITMKEINRAVKNYFSDDDLTVIISAPEPEKDSLPTDAGIRAMVASARRAKIAPPVTERPKGELLAEIPLPGSIVSESIDDETGAVRWRLSNGAEIILKETANKNSEITLYALARGGTMSVSEEEAVSAAFAAEMLNASGLGSYSLSDLTKLLLDKQVSMSFWTHNFLRGFQGNAAVKDAQTLFEMLHLSFTQPRFDEEAVMALLDQRRSRMAFQENNPDTVFRRELTRTVYGNPRYHPLVIEDLDKVNLNEALAFIKRCLNPADFTFVIAGNLDLPLFRSLTETYLASIPISSNPLTGEHLQPFNEWADMDPRRPSNTEKEIRKGLEERSIVSLQWYRPQSYSEEKYAAVSVLSEYLDIQLTEEIREAMGGVYSIGSWVGISPLPRDELSGGFSFVCDPKRVEELILAAREEFRKIARGEIDISVFEKAVEAMLKGHEELVQSNLNIAQSYANSAVIYRLPLSRQDSRPALYRAVNRADIQKTAAELLEGSMVRVVLYPEGGTHGL